MTLTELKSLTGSQLRILVAEAEGYSDFGYMTGIFGDSLTAMHGPNQEQMSVLSVPQYTECRDAITEAIMRRFTTDVEMCRFSIELMKIVNGKHLVFTIATASAADLSRAFLIALNPTENTK